MPENKLITLGKGLREARKKHGLSQERLSELSGVSTRHIGGIEKGEINPSFEVIDHLLEILGTSLDAILHPVSEQQQSEIQEIIDLYRMCPREKQKMLLVTIRALGHELLESEAGSDTKKAKK